MSLRWIRLGTLLIVISLSLTWLLRGGSDTPRDMAFIPAGLFLMGQSAGGALLRLIEDPTGDRETFRDERVQRTEQVAAFYLDRYEVTNAHYASYVTASAGRLPSGWRGQPHYPAGEGKHPVVGITQAAAEAYCHWVGKRLPTEEEWEKAARGEHGRRYPWGEAFAAGKTNTWEAGEHKPVSVYAYPGDVSVYHVYNLAGNVAEWTSTMVQLWTDETRIVVKGGSWTVDGKEWDLSAQTLAPPYGMMNYVGFRCAKSVTPAADGVAPQPRE